MNHARLLPRSVCLNGKIYVIGGRTSSTNGITSTPTCEVYSPNSDEWHFIASLPYPDTGCNDVIVVKNQIIVPLMRDVTFDFSHDAVKYNVRTNTWRKVEHFGPSSKLACFTLCTTKLPAMILQRLPKALFSDDVFGEDSENDMEDDSYRSDGDDSLSFFGWRAVHGFMDWAYGSSDDEAYW